VARATRLLAISLRFIALPVWFDGEWDYHAPSFDQLYGAVESPIKMKHESNLYGPDNEPLTPQKTDRETLEALIRSELVDAKAGLRESNQKDLREIKEDWSRPWKRAGLAMFIASIVLNVWFFFQGKEFL
jgi:hypothetical protein